MPDANDFLRAAIQANREGDLAERDRQYALAMAALKQGHIDQLSHYLEIDFFVSSDGVVIPITLLHQA